MTRNPIHSRQTVIADSNVKAYDEWDCLVNCCVGKAPKATVRLVKDGLRRRIEKRIGSADRWIAEWSSGKAGVLCKRDAKKLPYDEVLQWAKKALALTQEELDAHRSSFFKKDHNLPDVDFTFVGREDELCALKARLEQQKSVCLSTAALNGIGGQGKTAIACQYARLHLEYYAAVIWIDARGDVEQQFNAFARTKGGLTLEEEGTAAARFSSTFEQLMLTFRGRSLIIFDDVPANPNSEQLPSRAEMQIATMLTALPAHLKVRYHFLLTSRHHITHAPVESLPVERMTREDAIDLFVQRSGWARASLDEDRLVLLVDHLLGGHPLAISLIAAFARERRIRSIDTLSDLVKRHIVDPDESPAAVLYATFKINYDQLTQEAQLLFLVLGMFRRGVIAVKTVKSCARRMIPATPAVDALRASLGGRGGPTPSTRLLTRLALVERIDDSRRSQRAQVRLVQLHEVIYDFVQAQWIRLRAEPQWREVVNDLELAFTRGAIAHASDEIQAADISFRDIDSLTGLLLPQVRPARGLLPSPERIAESLTFWYEHFVFQNFVYDTGLQDSLLQQMLELRSYLEENRQLTDRFGLILDKLIGHAYYANPGETGALAGRHFDRALALAEQLDAAPATTEGEISIARWYKIFLLDHRSNVASKNRPANTRTLPIRDDPQFAGDFDLIEKALPATLHTLYAAPSEEECELLLRAAHYWGHRGNQDSYIQYEKFLAGTLQPQGDVISQAARDHYVRALNYRLLTLKIFRAGQFKRDLGGKKLLGKLLFLVPWIDTVPVLEPTKRFETFTSLAQGVGDMAHQYRCLHFVLAIDCLTATDAAKRAELCGLAERSLECARTLWGKSRNVSDTDEAPLRYQLWMASSEVLMRLLKNVTSGHAIQSLDSMLEDLHRSIDTIQKTMRCTYQHSVRQQERQLRAIWGRMGA